MRHPVAELLLLLGLLGEHQVKGLLLSQSSILYQFLIRLPTGDVGVQSFLLAVEVGLEVHVLFLSLAKISV